MPQAVPVRKKEIRWRIKDEIPNFAVRRRDERENVGENGGGATPGIQINRVRYVLHIFIKK